MEPDYINPDTGTKYFLFDTFHVGRSTDKIIFGVSLPEQNSLYLVQLDPVPALQVVTQLIEQIGNVLATLEAARIEFEESQRRREVEGKQRLEIVRS